MAKAPHPASQIAIKEPEDEEETLGHHGPKDRDSGETDDQVETEVAGNHNFVPPPGWFSMDIAPTSGKPVLLMGLVDGEEVQTPAYCHNSRRYTGSASRWVDFREWRILNTPTPVPFEPLAWTRFE